MGSSGLMALPAEADFDTPIAAEIERYMSTESATARERAKLFYLAGDVACSGFGGRPGPVQAILRWRPPSSTI